MGSTVEAPEVAYLSEPQPVTDELLASGLPVNPTDVFRTAGPYVGSACQDFDAADLGIEDKTIRGEFQQNRIIKKILNYYLYSAII